MCIRCAVAGARKCSTGEAHLTGALGHGRFDAKMIDKRRVAKFYARPGNYASTFCHSNPAQIAFSVAKCQGSERFSEPKVQSGDRFKSNLPGIMTSQSTSAEYSIGVVTKTMRNAGNSLHHFNNFFFPYVNQHV